MTFIDRITTDGVPALIAEQVPMFTDQCRRKNPVYAHGRTDVRTARRNQEALDAAVDELRQIWRLANRNDWAWRPRMIAWLEQHWETDALTTKRFSILVRHAAPPEEQAARQAVEDEGKAIYYAGAARASLEP